MYILYSIQDTYPAQPLDYFRSSRFSRKGVFSVGTNCDIMLNDICRYLSTMSWVYTYTHGQSMHVLQAYYLVEGSLKNVLDVDIVLHGRSNASGIYHISTYIYIFIM